MGRDAGQQLKHRTIFERALLQRDLAVVADLQSSFDDETMRTWYLVVEMYLCFAVLTENPKFRDHVRSMFVDWTTAAYTRAGADCNSVVLEAFLPFSNAEEQANLVAAAQAEQEKIAADLAASNKAASDIAEAAARDQAADEAEKIATDLAVAAASKKAAKESEAAAKGHAHVVAAIPRPSRFKRLKRVTEVEDDAVQKEQEENEVEGRAADDAEDSEKTDDDDAKVATSRPKRKKRLTDSEEVEEVDVVEQVLEVEEFQRRRSSRARPVIASPSSQPSSPTKKPSKSLSSQPSSQSLSSQPSSPTKKKSKKSNTKATGAEVDDLDQDCNFVEFIPGTTTAKELVTSIQSLNDISERRILLVIGLTSCVSVVSEKLAIKDLLVFKRFIES